MWKMQAVTESMLKSGPECRARLTRFLSKCWDLPHYLKASDKAEHRQLISTKMKLNFCLDEKPALSRSGSPNKITGCPPWGRQKPASIMLSQIYNVLWRETRDVQPTQSLQISCWTFINPPHFRYQSRFAGLGISFHLVNTNRGILKPPFDPGISLAGCTTGSALFSQNSLLQMGDTTCRDCVRQEIFQHLAAPLLPTSITYWWVVSHGWNAARLCCMIMSSAALAWEVRRVRQGMDRWKIWESGFSSSGIITGIA